MTAPAPDSPARDLSLAAAGVTVVLWASAFVGIRAVGEAFSPGPLALGRLVVAALVLTVFAWPRRGPWPRGRTLAYVIGFGALWFGAYNVALNAGEQHVDAGTAALLVQLGPILIAVLAGLFLGEGFPPALVAGIVVAFAGVALIAFGSGEGGLGGDRLGVVLCVAAAVLYAAGVLLQKPALVALDGLQATWLGCVIGAVVCLPWAPQLVTEVGDASAAEIGGVVYLGVFPTALAFTTWAYALRRLGAGRTSDHVPGAGRRGAAVVGGARRDAHRGRVRRRSALPGRRSDHPVATASGPRPRLSTVRRSKAPASSRARPRTRPRPRCRVVPIVARVVHIRAHPSPRSPHWHHSAGGGWGRRVGSRTGTRDGRPDQPVAVDVQEQPAVVVLEHVAVQ